MRADPFHGFDQLPFCARLPAIVRFNRPSDDEAIPLRKIIVRLVEGDDLSPRMGASICASSASSESKRFFISAPVSLNLRFITWQKLFQPCCDVIDLCDRIRHGEPNVRVLLMLVPRMTMRLLLFVTSCSAFSQGISIPSLAVITGRRS